jgi:endonuclease/exonuclease/phosphatase family metal-dependent hydrolase
MTWDPANDFAAEFNEPSERVDYVFVGESTHRADRAGRVLNASLAFDSKRTGVFASDHYGLSIDVAWPTRPPLPNE